MSTPHRTMTRYTKTNATDKFNLAGSPKGDYLQPLSVYLRRIWNKPKTSFDRLPRRRLGIIHVVQLLHRKFRGVPIKGVTAQEAFKRAKIDVKGLKPLTKRQRLHLNEPPEEPEIEVLKDVSPTLPCLSQNASESSDQDIDIDIEGEDSDTDSDESADDSSTEEESAETMTLKSESANVDDEDMDCSSSMDSDDEEMTSDLESGVGSDSERLSVNDSASASQQATKLKNKIKITLHQPLPQEWSFSTSAAAKFKIRDLGNQGISIEVEEAGEAMAM